MPSKHKIILAFILLIGVAFQSAEYFSNRSLNVDEAYAAVYTIGQFDGQSDKGNSQGYPFGFLVVEKALSDAGGEHELVLRLFPFVCGLLALFVFARVSAVILCPPFDLLATTCFAVNPRLIYFSSELRPYSCDVCLALILLLLALETASVPGAKIKYVFLALWGAVAVWLSHASVFVLAGVGGALAWCSLKEQNKKQLGYLLVTGSVWTGSFLLHYFIHVQKFAKKDFLIGFWSDKFFPLDLTSLRSLSWLGTSFLSFFHEVLFVPALVAALCALLGWISLLRRKRHIAILFLVQLLAVLAASAFRKYPFGGRLLLFLVPAFMIVLAEAVFVMVRQKRFVLLRAFAGGVCLVLCFYPLRASLRQAFETHGAHESRDVIRFLASHYQPGDAIFLNNNIQSQLAFYFTAADFPERIVTVNILIDMLKTKNSKEQAVMRQETFGFEDGSRFSGKKDAGEFVWVPREKERPFGSNRRTWLLLLAEKPNLRRFVLELFNRDGVKQIELLRPGASLWLYDLTAGNERLRE